MNNPPPPLLSDLQFLRSLRGTPKHYNCDIEYVTGCKPIAE